MGRTRLVGSPGFSDHALVEYMVLRDIGQAKSIVKTLNLRKANFQLFPCALITESGYLLKHHTAMTVEV